MWKKHKMQSIFFFVVNCQIIQNLNLLDFITIFFKNCYGSSEYFFFSLSTLVKKWTNWKGRKYLKQSLMYSPKSRDWRPWSSIFFSKLLFTPFRRVFSAFLHQVQNQVKYILGSLDLTSNLSNLVFSLLFHSLIIHYF